MVKNNIFGFFKEKFIGLLISIVDASYFKKCVSLRLDLLLLIYILINTLKSYVTINLQLIEINMLEVVILLIIFPVKYVLQTKLKI